GERNPWWLRRSFVEADSLRLGPRGQPREQRTQALPVGAYALHQVGPDRVGLEAVGAPDEELLVAQQLDPRVVGAPAAGCRLHAVAADLPPGLVVLLQQPLERRSVLV